jgi:hypothetical protein
MYLSFSFNDSGPVANISVLIVNEGELAHLQTMRVRRQIALCVVYMLVNWYHPDLAVGRNDNSSQVTIFWGIRQQTRTIALASVQDPIPHQSRYRW